jgi:hypothetical protein
MAITFWRSSSFLHRAPSKVQIMTYCALKVNAFLHDTQLGLIPSYFTGFYNQATEVWSLKLRQ